MPRTTAHAHLALSLSHVYTSTRVPLVSHSGSVVLAVRSGYKWHFCRFQRMSDNDDIEVDSDVRHGAPRELFTCLIRPQCLVEVSACVINKTRASVNFSSASS